MEPLLDTQVVVVQGTEFEKRHQSAQDPHSLFDPWNRRCTRVGK